MTTQDSGADSPLVVPAAFRGPRDSANGGWTAGALALRAGGLGATVEVTLRQPPPLDTPMDVSEADGTWTAATGAGPVATARVVDADLTVVPPVPAAAAREAAERYPGLTQHPFATCFSCGTGRAEGDGLRIFPGRVEDAPDHPGSARVAAPWVPSAASYEITWAALDCSGAWALDMEERLLVLGRITARVDRLPTLGEEHVVTGLALGRDGRKHRAATSLHDSSGALLGVAEQVWIEVDRAAFA